MKPGYKTSELYFVATLANLPYLNKTLGLGINPNLTVVGAVVTVVSYLIVRYLLKLADVRSKVTLEVSKKE